MTRVRSITAADLVAESVEVHDEVLGSGVAVPHPALVAVRVPPILRLGLTRAVLRVLGSVLGAVLGSSVLGPGGGGEPHEVLVEAGHLRGRGLGVGVAQPVVGVVDLDEVGHQLRLGLADVSAPALVGSEHRVVVQRVIHHGVAWDINSAADD